VGGMHINLLVLSESRSSTYCITPSIRPGPLLINLIKAINGIEVILGSPAIMLVGEPDSV
jgi:hypothetical protein